MGYLVALGMRWPGIPSAGILSAQPVFGLYSLISPDILHGFSQSVHHMKALYVQMMDLYLIFQFVKGRFDGNQIILPL